MSTISIIGTGSMAAAIGGLAAKAGHTAEVMSRDAAKARALAGQVGAGATNGTASLHSRTPQGRTMLTVPTTSIPPKPCLPVPRGWAGVCLAPEQRASRPASGAEISGHRRHQRGHPVPSHRRPTSIDP